MDEYSKSGPKRPRSDAISRERETIRQMRALADMRDEETLKEALRRDYGIDDGDPRFRLILKTWRELQRRQP
jgi:hypothetical protein